MNLDSVQRKVPALPAAVPPLPATVPPLAPSVAPLAAGNPQNTWKMAVLAETGRKKGSTFRLQAGATGGIVVTRIGIGT
jgi:hypothetical protein